MQGRSGLKGSKGERGTPFTTVLRQGSYIEVKVSCLQISMHSL